MLLSTNLDGRNFQIEKVKGTTPQLYVIEYFKNEEITKILMNNSFKRQMNIVQN